MPSSPVHRRCSPTVLTRSTLLVSPPILINVRLDPVNRKEPCLKFHLHAELLQTKPSLSQGPSYGIASRQTLDGPTGTMDHNQFKKELKTHYFRECYN